MWETKFHTHTNVDKIRFLFVWIFFVNIQQLMLYEHRINFQSLYPNCKDQGNNLTFHLQLLSQETNSQETKYVPNLVIRVLPRVFHTLQFVLCPVLPKKLHRFLARYRSKQYWLEATGILQYTSYVCAISSKRGQSKAMFNLPLLSCTTICVLDFLYVTYFGSG
jgi:hypothetical protein